MKGLTDSDGWLLGIVSDGEAGGIPMGPADVAIAQAAVPPQRVRYVAPTWVLSDPRGLPDQKGDKRRDLRAAAGANMRRNITVQGVEFAADDDALADLAREAFFARIDGDAFTLTWPRASGAWVVLNAAQTIGLARAIRDRAEAIRQQLRDKLQAVAAAATAADVAAIGWTTL